MVCAEENNFLNFDQNILKNKVMLVEICLSKGPERPEKISVNAKEIFTPAIFFLYLSLSSGNLSRKIEVSNGNTLIER